MSNFMGRHTGGVGAGVFLVVLMAVTPQLHAADADAKFKLGREVFTSIAVPQCGLCHTLKDAGSTGEIGPHLAELKPDTDRVATAVRKGLGIMPPFAGRLTEEQIQAVAHYVAQAVKSEQ